MGPLKMWHHKFKARIVKTVVCFSMLRWLCVFLQPHSAAWVQEWVAEWSRQRDLTSGKFC